MSGERQDILEHVVDIVCAYVGNHNLSVADLPGFVGQVHAGLSGLGKNPFETEAARPAVSPGKSVRPDHIVCLEDGKRFKSLRRHLATAHGLTPEQYRARWKLARDYPMTAPDYSATRSQLAIDSGLGRKAAPKANARKKSKRA